jgi:hypothetical protein
MVFRRAGGDDEREEIVDEDEDGLNILSDEDDEDAEPVFAAGDTCWVCQDEPGRVGLDPTCHGAYGADQEPVLLGERCLEATLIEAYSKNDGIAVLVEPFGDNDQHLYYRIDEMPAYQFPREDVEGISWILLTIGGACARCKEQSHFAWLKPAFVDPDLPEDPDRAVFRNLDSDFENLCRSCAAKALAKAYLALGAPLLNVELPRSAMGVMMPSGA